MRTVNTEQQDKENIFNSADTSFNYAEHSHMKQTKKKQREAQNLYEDFFFLKKAFHLARAIQRGYINLFFI